MEKQSCNCNNNQEDSCLSFLGFVVLALILFRIGLAVGINTVEVLCEPTQKTEKRQNLSKPMKTQDSTCNYTNKEN